MLVVIAILLFLILCAITGTLPLLVIVLAIIIPIGIGLLLIIGVKSIISEVIDESNKKKCAEIRSRNEIKWKGYVNTGLLDLVFSRGNQKESLTYQVYRKENCKTILYRRVSGSSGFQLNSISRLTLENRELWDKIQDTLNKQETDCEMTFPNKFLFFSFTPIKVNCSYDRYLTPEEINQIKMQKIVIPRGNWPASEDV